jgi:hypothetical protein
MSNKIEDIYAPIGELIVSFQSLEMHVNLLLIDLLGQDYDSGFCLTSEMSFARLVVSLKSVSEVRIKNAALVQEICDLAGKIKICDDNRNKITHSIFAPSSDGKLMRAKITAKQKNGLQKAIHEVSVQEIAEYTKQIKDTTTQVSTLAHKLKALGIIRSGFFGRKET